MYNEKFMNRTVELAKKALSNNEVPIGCLIEKNGEIIAESYNFKENKKCSIYHSEILAIMEASNKLDNWRLDDCSLYVTLEPCPMCMSAIHQSRISNVYFGIYNSNKKIRDINKEICSDNYNNKIVNVEGGYLQKECLNILQDFYKKKRNKI